MTMQRCNKVHQQPFDALGDSVLAQMSFHMTNMTRADQQTR
jgi:hypothetical protein